MIGGQKREGERKSTRRYLTFRTSRETASRPSLYRSISFSLAALVNASGAEQVGTFVCSFSRAYFSAYSRGETAKGAIRERPSLSKRSAGIKELGRVR